MGARDAVPPDDASRLVAELNAHPDGHPPAHEGEYRVRLDDGRYRWLRFRGMSVREIAGHVRELYGVEVSPDLISAVTDAVLDEVAEWQNRPLDLCYPLVFFDAIRVKVRDEGFVRNKAIYLALGVLPDGTKEILGIWIEQTEGAKFWLRVVNELKTRGAQDILIAVVDGLKGFPEAITAVFPLTSVQTCIVHLSRYFVTSSPFAAGKRARRWLAN